MVDPPADCEAYCLAVDQVDFTMNRSDPGAGPLTAQFIENIRENVEFAHSEGKQVCNEPGIEYGAEALLDGYVLTPCALGYPPQVLKSESLDACTPPPPWCQ